MIEEMKFIRNASDRREATKDETKCKIFVETATRTLGTVITRLQEQQPAKHTN